MGFHLNLMLLTAALPNVSAIVPSNWLTLSGSTDQETEAVVSDSETFSTTNVKLVRLRRRNARPFGHSYAGKSFYTAQIFVGHPRPQALNVIFDTASGQVVLPDAECKSQACLEHRRYQSVNSAVAVDVNADGVLDANSTERDAVRIGFSSLDLGDGAVLGHLLTDAMCFRLDLQTGEAALGQSPRHPGMMPQKKACTQVGLVSAISLSDVPFRAAPYDGVVGLGLKGLSLRPGFNFLDSLVVEPHHAEKEDSAVQASQQFALYHGRRFGEAAFGGYNPKRLASPLAWAPVASPMDGYWQVQIQSVRIGNQTLDACEKGKCRGIIDSGTSALGIHSNMMVEFQSAFLTEHLWEQEAAGCGAPDLHLELFGGVALTLKAEDYVRNEGSSICKPMFSSLELPESFEGVIVFGEQLLRRYYTVFDWKEGNERIGFGLAAAHDALEEELASNAEAKEDWENNQKAVADGLPGSEFGVVFEMLHGLATRLVFVLALLTLGNNMTSSRTFMNYVEKMLAQKRFLAEVAGLTTAIPVNELPSGDECVICLGSCEDETQSVAGLQAPLPYCGKEASCNPSGPSASTTRRPNWLRLNCGHHFHETCIFEWLRKSQQCPICRRHLKQSKGASFTSNSALP